MKNLFTKIFMLSLIAAFSVGCGSDNNSGGSSSSSTAPVTQEPAPTPAQGNINSNEIVDINIVRRKFEAKSMMEGLRVDDMVYFTGSDYISGFSSNVQVSACVSLIFWQSKGCGEQFNNQEDLYFNQLISSGSLYQIKSGDASAVNVAEVQDYRDGRPVIGIADAYGKNSQDYQSMLGLNASANAKVVASRAQLTLTNGQTVEAYHIEIFEGYNKQSYVVSPALPVFANPVMNVNSLGHKTGYLAAVGSLQVQKAKVQMHQVETSWSGITQTNNVKAMGVVEL